MKALDRLTLLGVAFAVLFLVLTFRRHQDGHAADAAEASYVEQQLELYRRHTLPLASPVPHRVTEYAIQEQGTGAWALFRVDAEGRVTAAGWE